MRFIFWVFFFFSFGDTNKIEKIKWRFFMWQSFLTLFLSFLNTHYSELKSVNASTGADQRWYQSKKKEEDFLLKHLFLSKIVVVVGGGLTMMIWMLSRVDDLLLASSTCDVVAGRLFGVSFIWNMFNVWCTHPLGCWLELAVYGLCF